MQGCVDWATSHLAKVYKELYKIKGFYRQKEVGQGSYTSKELIVAMPPFFRGQPKL